MSPAAGIGVGVASAMLAWWLGGRWRWVMPLAVVAVGVVAAVLLRVPISPEPARLASSGLGTLGVTRIAAGVLVGGLGALALELLVAGERGPGPAAVAMGLLATVPSALALLTTGMVPLALSAGLLMAMIWVRWQRVAGPQLPIRSLARQALLVLASLLAAAVLMPSARLGSAPMVLEAILLAGGVTGLLGVMPFAAWVGAAIRVGRSEASLWRIWAIPVGVLVGARLIATSPAGVALPLQELLLALGVASSLFWGLRAVLGPPATRYSRVLAADSGLICTAVGLGSSEGLTAALLLVLAHWLGGAVLGEESGTRSQLLAWIGLSGIPPFGGFAGRILIVIAAAAVSFTLVWLLLLAMGLQLAAAASAMRSTLSNTASAGPWRRELIGLVAAASILVLGLVPGQAMQAVLGLHP
ncbi:MAG TPA: hypothetical protein VMV23_10560 [Candidatus Nanopelagicaceae bacterium]|nr:hypothetical protein [Candidatus Nanopelagicaceae bacterium]